MRIIKANVALDSDKHPVLVKKHVKNYDSESNFSDPETIVRVMNTLFGLSDAAEEYVWILAMDTKCHALAVFELSHGTAGCSHVGIREAMMRLLLAGASCFVLLHNHPSGDVCASADDLKVTKRLADAADLMCIRFLDHIIVGRNQDGAEIYQSLKSEGMMQQPYRSRHT